MDLELREGCDGKCLRSHYAKQQVLQNTVKIRTMSSGGAWSTLSEDGQSVTNFVVGVFNQHSMYCW